MGLEVLQSTFFKVNCILLDLQNTDNPIADRSMPYAVCKISHVTITLRCLFHIKFHPPPFLLAESPQPPQSFGHFHISFLETRTSSHFCHLFLFQSKSFRVFGGKGEGKHKERPTLLSCVSAHGNVYLLKAGEELVEEKRNMSKMNNKMGYKQEQIYCDTSLSSPSPNLIMFPKCVSWVQSQADWSGFLMCYF